MDPGDDPVIVAIAGGGDGNVGDWPASLIRDEPPIEFPIPAAGSIAEGRAESR